jgi:hypothetical protein
VVSVLVGAPELAVVPGRVFVTGWVFVPGLVFATGGVFAARLAFAPEAVSAPGVAPLLATCATGALPPLGVAVPEVASLLGVPVPELLSEEDVYACPATAALAGANAVAWPGCQNAYAMAPPRARVATTFSVMNTIATRSLMGAAPSG